MLGGYQVRYRVQSTCKPPSHTLATFCALCDSIPLCLVYLTILHGILSVYFYVAIRLPTDATLNFVYLFPFLPYMFRALISPSSGVSRAVFYVQPFGSYCVYVAHLRVPVDWIVVVVSPRQTSPQAHADEQHKHCMNQMAVYKKTARDTPDDGIMRARNM